MTREALIEAGILRRDGGDGWLLEVHAQPGAKRTEAAGRHGDRLKVRLAAPPVDGKANKVLIAWAARWFGTSRTKVSLVRGQTSRRKTIRIEE